MNSFRRILLIAGSLLTVVALLLPTVHAFSHLTQERSVDVIAWSDTEGLGEAHDDHAGCATCEVTASLRATLGASQDWSPAADDRGIPALDSSAQVASPTFAIDARGPPTALA